MRNWVTMQQMAVWSAVISLVFQPQWLCAEEVKSVEEQAQAEAAAVRVVDVKLHANGILAGQVVDAQGQSLSATEVQLSNARGQWQTVTDSQGRFRFAGLKGGSYQAQVAQQQQLIRAWAPGTAPPRAATGLLIVQDNDLVLGQDCGSPVCGSPVSNAAARLKRPLANPWILGGLVAAAIAIPVAIHNSDDDDPPSS